MVTFEMPLDVAMICYILWTEGAIRPATEDEIYNLQVPYWIAVGYAQAKDLIPDPKGTKEAYYTLLNYARDRFTKLTGRPVT